MVKVNSSGFLLPLTTIGDICSPVSVSVIDCVTLSCCLSAVVCFCCVLGGRLAITVWRLMGTWLEIEWSSVQHIISMFSESLFLSRIISLVFVVSCNWSQTMRPRWALEHGPRAKQQRQHPLLLCECVGAHACFLSSKVCAQLALLAG